MLIFFTPLGCELRFTEINPASSKVLVARFTVDSLIDRVEAILGIDTIASPVWLLAYRVSARYTAKAWTPTFRA